MSKYYEPTCFYFMCVKCQENPMECVKKLCKGYAHKREFMGAHNSCSDLGRDCGLGGRHYTNTSQPDG